MAALNDPEDDRPLKPPAIPREYERPETIHAVEAPTLPPPLETSTADVLAAVRDLKSFIADFRINVETRLSKLEGHAKATRGDLIVIGAETEEMHRDFNGLKATVEQTNELVLAHSQTLDGLVHLGKSNYEISVDLKRHLKNNGHGPDEETQRDHRVESEEEPAAAGVVGR
jgi:hypothetical protein